MTKRQEATAKVIARSSLGAPAVVRLRSRTSVQQRSRILRKASARSTRDLSRGATRSSDK